MLLEAILLSVIAASTPLLLAAAGELVVERSGVLNLGVEGMMIIGAACGGTHRLTGFSYSIRKRQQRKEPMDGQWERARKFIEDYHQYTFKLQNPDGSFSTNWFEGREDNGPPSRRLVSLDSK